MPDDRRLLRLSIGVDDLDRLVIVVDGMIRGDDVLVIDGEARGAEAPPPSTATTAPLARSIVPAMSFESATRALVVLDSIERFYARRKKGASPEWLAGPKDGILGPDADRS